MNYTELKLSSGQTVQVRARTYEEWEGMEQERLDMLEELAKPEIADSPRRIEGLLQRRFHLLRGKLLAMQVKDFAKLKPGLSLRDVAEIEKKAKELEELEIPLGN